MKNIKKPELAEIRVAINSYVLANDANGLKKYINQWAFTTKTLTKVTIPCLSQLDNYRDKINITLCNDVLKLILKHKISFATKSINESLMKRVLERFKIDEFQEFILEFAEIDTYGINFSYTLYEVYMSQFFGEINDLPDFIIKCINYDSSVVKYEDAVKVLTLIKQLNLNNSKALFNMSLYHPSLAEHALEHFDGFSQYMKSIFLYKNYSLINKIRPETLTVIMWEELLSGRDPKTGYYRIDGDKTCRLPDDVIKSLLTFCDKFQLLPEKMIDALFKYTKDVKFLYEKPLYDNLEDYLYNEPAHFNNRNWLDNKFLTHKEGEQLNQTVPLKQTILTPKEMAYLIKRDQLKIFSILNMVYATKEFLYDLIVALPDYILTADDKQDYMNIIQLFELDIILNLIKDCKKHILVQDLAMILTTKLETKE